MSSPDAATPTPRRALLSCHDKTGLAALATALHTEFGFDLLSTGGTARILTEAGLPVTLVEHATGFPEMLDGRVKTLHPAVHAGILADRDKPQHLAQLADAGITPIDVVVVDLYPFERTIEAPDATLADAIEMIDIGGVALLRAAAKNFRHVWVAATAAQRELLLAGLRDWRRGAIDAAGAVARRQTLAIEAFRATSAYDRSIGGFLARSDHETGDALPTTLEPAWMRGAALRYGENPHQQAAVYRATRAGGVANAAARGELSYNNYLDADAAFRLCCDLAVAHDPVAVFIKHTNACGVGATPRGAAASNPNARLDAYRRAYLGDPNAAMGGILAVNFAVDATFAEAVMETYARFGKPLRDAGHAAAPGGFFVEVWVAPHFADDAIEIVRTRKPWGARVRLLTPDDFSPPSADTLDLRSISGGVLAQTTDARGVVAGEWRVVSRRSPTETEQADLKLAWLICKHTKSNAITLCRDGMLLGNGCGQTSRVMSCRIATWQTRENHGAQALRGSAAASDAFFPFPDGLELLAEAGTTAIIQPGGSKNDDAVIAAADARDVALVFTGTRHFRH